MALPALHTLKDDLHFLLTNRLPRRWATQFMGWFSAIEVGWVRDLSLRHRAPLSSTSPIEDCASPSPSSASDRHAAIAAREFETTHETACGRGEPDGRLMRTGFGTT